MRIRFIILLIAFSYLQNKCSAQYTANFVQRDTTGVDDARPGAGLNDYFNLNQTINYPNGALTGQHSPDLYFRITWDELSKGWTGFDAFFNLAISRRQKVIFRIVAADDSYTGNTVSGARMAYPAAIHTAMQAETNKDYIPSGTSVWFPNWNSPSFLAGWSAIVTSVRSHINATSNSGWRYQDVLYAMDIGGIGIYGEGHRFGAGAGGSWPTGTQWTLASLQSMVNIQISQFPEYPLIGNINFLNANSELPSGFGSFYLNASNSWGPLGMRWDHVCDKGTYDYEYTNKTTVENGVNFKTEEGRRWMSAPVLGEPQQFNYSAAGQCDYYHSWTEAMTFHASMIENANNIMNGGAVSTCTADLFRSIAKRMGYRHTLYNITMSDSIIPNGPLSIALNGANIGIAPAYSKWTVTFELWQAGAMKFSYTSTWTPFMVLPGVFTISAIPITNGTWSGLYDLRMRIADPTGYWNPMFLQITGRQADGSYLLRSGIAVAKNGSTPPPPPPPPPNQPPVILMGQNQVDTLPKNTDTLTAQVTDPNNDAFTLAWSQVSGPNTATITGGTTATAVISGLIEGTYQFRLTANDGKGGISSAFVNVTVYTSVITPPPPPPPTYRPPVINAGNDTTIFLTADSAILRGTVTQKDTLIQSVSWTKFSGIGGTIVTPNDSTTRVTGLTLGDYQYAFTITDKAGNVVVDYKIVHVKNNSQPPPLPPIPDNPKVSGIKNQ